MDASPRSELFEMLVSGKRLKSARDLWADIFLLPFIVANERAMKFQRRTALSTIYSTASRPDCIKQVQTLVQSTQRIPQKQPIKTSTFAASACIAPPPANQTLQIAKNISYVLYKTY
jgi:hypothetical protein